MKLYTFIALLLLPLFLFGQKRNKVKMPKKALESKVAMHLGKPTIFINEEPQSSVLYALTDAPGGRWTWEELPQHNLEVFCEHDVRMYQLDISFEQMWKEDGTLDISIAQRQVRGLLEVCPNAAVFFRLHVNAPYWWQHSHRDQHVIYGDTVALPILDYGLHTPLLDDPRSVERVSLASQKWREESSAMTALFCKKLSKSPEGRAVVGIQVACGVYGEWHYWGFSKNEPDFSKPMNDYFKKWTKEKYKTESNLQATWQNDNVSFETVSVPEIATRKTQKGVFRDPKSEQFVIDYYRCQHELVSDLIVNFCKIVKDNWKKPIITGTFYGYFFSVFGREVAGGHLEFRQVLESEYVDYISAPQTYGPRSRKHGEVYRSRGLLKSCLLNGKLWLDEMDIEPHLHYHRLDDFDQYVSKGRASTRRNMIFSMLHGMGLWFYDYGISGVEFDDFRPKYLSSTGWWDHPDIMADIQAIKKISDDKMAAKEPYKSDADVLFVFDTQSSYYTASLYDANPMTQLSVDWTTLAAFRTGIAFDAIHVGDLEKVTLDQYKVVIFGNTYELSQKQKDYIQNKVAQNNRHLVWIYAPDYVQKDSLSLTAVSKLVGINLKEINLPDKKVNGFLVGAPAQFLYQQDTSIHQINKKRFAPAFAVDDKDATAVSYYVTDKAVATAYKKFDTHTSWYMGAPPKEEKGNILRYILSQTEAHRYTEETDAVVYAGWGMLFYYCQPKALKETRTIRLKNGKVVTIKLPNFGCGILIDANTGALLLEKA